MSAMTLPLDNRESNNYIHALERQFGGKLRNARDLSVFFTTRTDTGDSVGLGLHGLFEEYKLLTSEFFPELDDSDYLDVLLQPGHYTMWFDATGEFLVTGDGVGLIGAGYWLIPSGAEVTVTQNGSLSVPSAETFVAQFNGDDFFALAYINELSVAYLLPYIGKAWYGVVTVPSESGVGGSEQLVVNLIKANGAFHTKTLPNKIMGSFEFFTHLSLLNYPDGEVYFTGKEFDYVPDGLPTGDYIQPTFTYVPD